MDHYTYICIHIYTYIYVCIYIYVTLYIHHLCVRRVRTRKQEGTGDGSIAVCVGSA